MNIHCIARREWLAWLALCAAGIGHADTGPSTDDIWRDAARGRDVPLRVRLPDTAGPWPVVLFSHGLGGSREGADAWGRAWQRAGIAVVHLQHPGSDIDTLREGIPRLREAANAQQLLARVADVRFAIDEIERRHRDGASPWRQARLASIGMAGHSFGAQTTQALAGQRFPMRTALAEPRLAAFVALSPSAGRSRMPLQEQFGAVDRPFMAVTGSLDGDPFGSYASGEPRARVYEGLPAGQRALLWLEGADHMSLAGNAERRMAGRGIFQRQPVAQQREQAHHALVAQITTLWWQAHLLGDTAARAALAHPQGLTDADHLTLG